jgi:hypothetical protein
MRRGAVAGKRHGVGRFVWGETGEVYVGDWSQDQRHGYGLYTWQVSPPSSKMN